MKKTIPLIVFAVVLLAGSVYLATKSTSVSVVNEKKVTDDPMGVTAMYYNQWLSARQSTSSNPYDMGLLQNDSITTDVRDYIAAASSTVTTFDPVLCLDFVPPRIGTKAVYEATSTAQIIVLPRKLETPSPLSAIVDLQLIDSAWKITNISCSNGEIPPASEFSFEKEGYITKTVPSPYTSGVWHIVFTQDDGRIGATPLIFDNESQCSTGEAVPQVCAADTLPDGARVYIKSNLTEDGTIVRELSIVGA